jgi:hypothetical protein
MGHSALLAYSEPCGASLFNAFRFISVTACSLKHPAPIYAGRACASAWNGIAMAIKKGRKVRP